MWILSWTGGGRGVRGRICSGTELTEQVGTGGAAAVLVAPPAGGGPGQETTSALALGLPLPYSPEGRIRFGDAVCKLSLRDPSDP